MPTADPRPPCNDPVLDLLRHLAADLEAIEPLIRDVETRLDALPAAVHEVELRPLHAIVDLGRGVLTRRVDELIVDHGDCLRPKGVAEAEL